MSFTVYPAIDLMGGRAVRLVRGERQTAEVVGEPLELLERFSPARMLHVVDLDGAFEGRPRQTTLIGALAKLHPIQAGGGVRTLDDVARLFDAGVTRVVVGTAALIDPQFIEGLVARFPSQQLVIAADVKDGFVAAAGWAEASLVRPESFSARLAAQGIIHVLTTAVHKDGTLEGPDLSVLAAVAQGGPGLSVIASGGIGSLADVEAVRSFAGVIIGKALYAGRFTLEQALDLQGGG